MFESTEPILQPILVTGASSFIGRHVVGHLVRSGYEVIAAYRTPNAFLVQLNEGAANLSLRQIDISRTEEFEKLPSRISAVVHIAGVSTEPGLTVDDMLATNVAGTRNVLRYAIASNAGRIIFTSSISVHGRIESPILDQYTPVVDPDIYGASKLLGERMLASKADEIPVVALRLPGVLGIGAHRAWLPTLLGRMKSHLNVEIYGPDATFNNAVDVNELAEFVGYLLFEHHWTGFMAMPIAADGVMTIRDVVMLFANKLRSKSNIAIVDASRKTFTISSEYAKSVGYRPSAIETILNRYIEHASRS